MVIYYNMVDLQWNDVVFVPRMYYWSKTFTQIVNKMQIERDKEEISVHSGRMIHQFVHPVDLHVKLCR